MNFNVSDFGAKADGLTLCTDAIQSAIDACHEAGGGRVILSGGTYLTGSITLKDNVNLHITESAVLKGSPRCEDYPERDGLCHVITDCLPRWRNACLIYAEECKNISITGMGTIDCGGDAFVRPKTETSTHPGWKYERIDAPTPPRAVFLAGCSNVKIEDITMINQPAGWSYWITDCDFVTCDKLKINASVDYPNNDGIHINCSRNVTVSNCSIICGDDCIVVRANSVALHENKICEKVVVTNCNLTSYASGIRIGWIKDGSIRNCTFSNIVMTDTNTGINITIPYIKPDPTRKLLYTADIGRESTLIENLIFSGIIMDKTAIHPIRIAIDPNPAVLCTAVRNLYFSECHTSGPEFPKIEGRAETPIENVSFTNCSFVITDGGEFDNLDMHGGREYTEQCYRPMKIRHAKNVTFNNTRFDILT